MALWFMNKEVRITLIFLFIQISVVECVGCMDLVVVG